VVMFVVGSVNSAYLGVLLFVDGAVQYIRHTLEW
jgi:hypothetical protein